MRTSWVLFASSLCTSAYSQGFQASGSAQQVLGSLDVSGNSYKCENGARPTANCVHPSEKPTCSCTCSNGITFNQPLSLSSSTGPGNSPDTCPAKKEQCLQRERECIESQEASSKRIDELMAELNQIKISKLQSEQLCNQKEQQHLLLQQQLTNELNEAKKVYPERDELADKLKTCKSKAFKYMGCYEDSATHLIEDTSNWSIPGLTPAKCADFCKGYKYYGLNGGFACFCGNTTRYAPKLVGGDKCDKKCTGDAGQICGGPWKMSLYQRED